MATRRQDRLRRMPLDGDDDARPAPPVPPTEEQRLTNAIQSQQRRADNKTDGLLAAGVQVNGVTLGATPQDQQRWSLLFNTRTALTYPVAVAGLLPDTTLALQNANQLASAYNDYALEVISILSEADQVKNSIKKATSAEEALAIGDSRTPKK